VEEKRRENDASVPFAPSGLVLLSHRSVDTYFAKKHINE
jgi:hypothetical protein